MKKIISPIYLTALLLTFVLTSCEKVIEFDGDETESYMVMISKPESDSPWKVRLTESRFFLYGDTIATIKDASVSIEVNGRTLNSNITNHGNGMYDLGYTPQQGDSLTLRVTTPNKGTMMAGCRIPHKPIISQASCTYDTTHYTEYYPDTVQSINGDITVKLTLEDPAEETNYYMLRMRMPSTNYNYTTESYDTIWRYNRINVNDNVLFDMDATNELFDIGSQDYYGTQILFTDERINGQTHTITFNTSIYGLEAGHPLVEVFSISRDRYLYEKSLQAAGEQDMFINLISEPVQIHSNVTGGLGILGGSAVTKIKID